MIPYLSIVSSAAISGRRTENACTGQSQGCRCQDRQIRTIPEPCNGRHGQPLRNSSGTRSPCASKGQEQRRRACEACLHESICRTSQPNLLLDRGAQRCRRSQDESAQPETHAETSVHS